MTNDMPGGRSRFSFFVESAAGLKSYFEICVDDLPHVADKSPLETLRSEFVATAKFLAEQGFKHDTSFDKPAYVGGGRPGAPRPEEKAPAGIIVPEHCGQPMIYHPAYTNKSQKEIDARFTCRKNKQCEAVTSGKSEWPVVNWHLTKIADGAQAPAANGARSQPMGYGDFLNAALKDYGQGKAAILKFAHTNEDELKRFGPDGWADLLSKMAAAKVDPEA